MSLQVWLPLTGHLNNQGLSNVTVTNSGATIDNNGKIGKCYSFNGTSSRIYANNVSIANNEMTACCWVKFLSAPASNTYPYIISLGGDSTVTGAKQQLGISWWKTSASNTIHICANGSELDTGFIPSLNQWYHLCFTYIGNVSKLYVNGELNYTGTNANTPQSRSNLCIGARSDSASGAGTAFKYPINGYLNDVRIYDHALSAKEVKELSKGLVLHYPLTGGGRSGDNLAKNSKELTPASSKTTLNISSRLGASRRLRSDGFYELCCTSNFQGLSVYANMLNLEAGDTLTFSFYTYTSSSQHTISFYPMMFNSSDTRDTTTKLYMCWDNGHAATANSLSYGSISSTTPQFHYVTFTWNSAVKSIIDNGGRIELSIQAHNGDWSDGSNICFFKPKLERSNIPTPWMPNSADAAYTAMGYDNNIEYDVSGYNYHGTKLGTITYDSDTARYNVSSKFNGTDSGILIENLQLSNIINTAVTYSFWIKSNDDNDRSVYFGSWSGTSWSVEKKTTNTLRLYWNGSPDETCMGATIVDGVWQHICITKQGTNNIKVYINGVQKWASTATHNNLTFPTTYRIGRDSRSGDGTPYKGLMSDFRIYATALSAEDVAELYNTAASLSNNSTLFAYEYVEV